MGTKSSVVSISCTPFDYLLYLLLWSPDILTPTLLQPPRTEVYQLYHLFILSPPTPIFPSQNALQSTFLTTSLLAHFLLPLWFSLICLTTPIQVSVWTKSTPIHDSKSHVDLWIWRAIMPLLSSIQFPTHWYDSHTHLFLILTFCWRTFFLFHWD